MQTTELLDTELLDTVQVDGEQVGAGRVARTDGTGRVRQVGDPRSAEGAPAAHGPVWAADWRPLAGPALLDRLRVTGRARPAADPDLVARLLAHLEHGLPVDGPVATGGRADATGRTPVVTAERLTRALACPAHAAADPGPADRSLPLACGALVDVLFRQLVTTGTIGDPLAEGLDALALDERRTPLVEWVDGLAPHERAELEAEVTRQAEGLRSRWPRLDPSWLPRTHDCLRVPLAGGAVELVTRVDLAVGRPATSASTVALVDVRSGARRPVHAADRGFQALLETVRSGVPPFVVATYYARTGELDVDPVTPELLVAAARRCRAGLEVLTADGRAPTAVGAPWCATCATSTVDLVAGAPTADPDLTSGPAAEPRLVELGSRPSSSAAPVDDVGPLPLLEEVAA